MIRKSVVLFSVNVAGRVFQYLYRVIMGYFLSLKDFGILSASLPYQSFVLLFTSMSITPTVSRFASEYKVSQKEKMVNVFSLLVVGLVVAGVLYGMTGLFSGFFGPEFAEAQSLLRILALAVPFAVLLCICTGIFLGYQRAGLVAGVLMVYQCVMVGSSYILVQHTGLQGAAQGILVGYVISGGIAFVIALKFSSIGKVLAQEVVRIIRFSLPVLLGVTGLWALLNIDILILARFATSEQVGLYGMASPTARLIFGFSTALSALLIPRVSEMKFKGMDPRKSVRRSLEICTVVTVPIAVVMSAFSKEILYVLFGNYDGYLGLQILSCGMLFYSIFFVGYSALQGMGHPERSMLIGIGSALVNGGVCFMLIPRFGLAGAALSTTLSCGLAMVLALVAVRIAVIPRIQYVVVFVPIFLIEYLAGIPGGRFFTMAVYSAIGLPFIAGYFYLSRKHLQPQSG
ncbi:MAG: flippase [Theionarchaea archaeon]|nr:flippase [Theionarchaea archaeon]MBU6999180.1 flippase [Theionarchaea archaeon]MBU7019695.1 flippase [Theionarchaea archaeon]MBU7034406.1 flippase [Theionarchaea archaeon]